MTRLSALITANSQTCRLPLWPAFFWAVWREAAMKPNQETFLQMCILAMIGLGFLVLAVAG